MLKQAFIFISFVLCGSVATMAQRDIPQNLPKFDSRRIHFGFQIGGSTNGFQLKPDLAQADSLVKISYQSQPGFNVHVVSELHMGPYLGLRFTPGISFSARILNYEYFQGAGEPTYKVDRLIESTFIDIPLLLKYRSKRVNNFANYIMAGFNYSIDLASQQFVDNQVDELGLYIVKLKRNNYNFECGVGFDFFLEYFKFSPEFKFSYSLNNVLVQDNTIYSSPIYGLNSRIFTVAFNFEG